jgi:uncharacterized repeat protein (TIGR03803 family)
VFEIAKTASGYANTPTTLVSFNNIDGAYPYAGVIADANGNLFGTTVNGGAYGYGTVFEIAKTASGYANTPTTLVSFNSIDGSTPYGGLIADANGNLFGSTPYGGLIADANGNLFGTTPFGGTFGGGTVFEIAKYRQRLRRHSHHLVQLLCSG